MTRVWDWIVGLSMIVFGIICQAILSALIAFPIVFGIDKLLGFHSNITMVVAWVGVFLILNAAGFVDYYKLRRINRAGIFHFIPRAIERIRSGHELPNAVDAYTGRPIDIQAPIRAGARLLIGIGVVTASVLTFSLTIVGQGQFQMVLNGLSLIGLPVGLLIVGQALLAYAGFIRRRPRAEQEA